MVNVQEYASYFAPIPIDAQAEGLTKFRALVGKIPAFAFASTLPAANITVFAPIDKTINDLLPKLPISFNLSDPLWGGQLTPVSYADRHACCTNDTV